MTSPPPDLIGASAALCRALRRRGVPVAVPETIAAVEALEALDLGDPRELRLGLRAVLTTSVDDYAAFDDAFRELWRQEEDAPPEDRRIPAPSFAEPDREPPAPRSSVSLERWLRQEVPELAGEDDASLRAPSPREGLGEKDFAAYGEGEMEALTRVARRLARRLSRTPGRRWRPARRGPRLHLRRTVRASLSAGGEAAGLVFRERKPRRTNLLVVCDVSGSMDLYSRFLLQFVYALQNAFHRVESFVFATRLSRISREIERGGYREALAELSGKVRDWSGGTRIGASLEALVEEWPRLLDRRTVVVILSDGWETGDPERLASAVEELGRRAGRVIWLNPLLGSPDYEPATRGLRAALPHVDVFAPAHNLEALEALTDHLVL